MKKLTVSVPVPEASGLWRSVWSCLLAAVLLIPSLIWISEDRRVWPWDQAWYAQLSTDLWYWLTHSPGRWLATMADGMDLKPPAIAWIGQFFVPLHRILGSTETALLVFIVITQFILLQILFCIGESFAPTSRLVPSVGVLFAAGGQLFAGLSHQYFVEPLQALAVAWVLLIAIRASDWPRHKIVLHLSASLALGELAKATTLAYCMLPVIYCVLVVFRKRPGGDLSSAWKSRLFRIQSLITVVVVLVGTAWYLRHVSSVLQHVRDATSGEIAAEYGNGGDFLTRFIVWIRLLAQAFLYPYLLWVCIAALAAAVFITYYNRANFERRGSRPWIVLLSLLQIGLVLLLSAVSISVDSRYDYAILPYISLLFMQLCAAFPRSILLVVLTMCGFQWAAVSYASLGDTRYLTNRAEWLLLPHRDPTQYEELARIVQITSDGPEHNNMIGIQEPWLNENSAAFFAAKHCLDTGRRTFYISAGYAQKDLAAALRRMEEYQTQYVIDLAEAFQPAPPNFLNLTALPLLQHIRADPRCKPEPFSTRNGIVLFRCSVSDTATPPAKTVDLTVVPTTILAAKVEAGGKSALDSLSGASGEVASGRRLFYIESHSIARCDGWAFDDRLKSAPAEVWIELTDVTTSRKHYWPAHRYSRPALAAAVKIPSIEWAGVTCDSVSYELPTGLYTMKVYQIAGQTAIVSDFSTWSTSPTVVVK